MIHQKNFPFHEPDDETEIIHVNHSGRFGLISKIIVILAIIILVGFAVRSAFNLGKGGEAYDGTIPVIEANPDPYKTVPEDPGGMEIPNIDKEIYGKLKSPIDSPLEEPSDAYANENYKDPLSRALKEESDRASLANKQLRSSSEPEIIRPATDNKPGPKTVRLNGKAKEVDIAQDEPATQPRAKRIDVEKVLAKKNETEIWLQLGSYKSEEEATKAWQETREKDSDILGDLTVKVTKSDMKDQGVLYRLQAGSVDDETAAKNYCSKLAARKLGCFYTVIKNND